MRLALLALLALAAVGCAGRGARIAAPGAPADARPAPVAAASDTAAAPVAPDSARAPAPPAAKPPAAAPAEPTPDTPPPPVESVVSPEERRQTMTRIIADTTAAGASVRRCSGRRLLPDQESVFDTARSLLGQTREALVRDELWRAESLARKARQLAASLNCPG